jgi:hypothetical protein
MEEELLLNEEDTKETEKETEESTPQDGNDSLSDEQFLAKVNEIEGRNYKTVEDYKKTVKHRNEEFAKQGQKKETETVTPNLAEEILYVREPEAELVKDDIKIVAETKYNGDMLRAYREESWLKDKALLESEKKKQKEESEGKMSAPSSQITGEGKKIKLSDADRKLMASYGLSEEDLIK